MTTGKVLMVGPYPPPEGGWSTAIREEREELEKRGVDCRVLNIGESRREANKEYICVHSGTDLIVKLLRHGLSGYRFRLHMNGDSLKGMAIVMAASLISAVCLRRPCLSFHAGIDQRHFPHHGNLLRWIVWTLVFNLSRIIICDSNEIRDRILVYRIGRRGVYGVSPFSSRRVAYVPVTPDAVVQSFLSSHEPVLFSYFAYRPEYDIGMLLEAVRRLRDRSPGLGLLAVDDRSHPDPAVTKAARALLEGDQLRGAVLTTGEVGRDEFLTLMSMSHIYVRTPLTDGVCSSVLEALYMQVPVVAADNGTRPPGVVTYNGSSIEDMVSTIDRAIEDREQLKESIGKQAPQVEDTVAQLADIVQDNCGMKS